METTLANTLTIQKLKFLAFVVGVYVPKERKMENDGIRLEKVDRDIPSEE